MTTNVKIINKMEFLQQNTLKRVHLKKNDF